MNKLGEKLWKNQMRLEAFFLHINTITKEKMGKKYFNIKLFCYSCLSEIMSPQLNVATEAFQFQKDLNFEG